jgi:hypothetical protein
VATTNGGGEKREKGKRAKRRGVRVWAGWKGVFAKSVVGRFMQKTSILRILL